jgi:hypothetical protein
MSPTFAEGTVRVITPPSYDAQPPVATRGLPDPAQLVEAAGQAELVAGLQDSDLSLVQTVDLTPRRSRDLATPGDAAPGKVAFEVDVKQDEDAVVLLERDGVFSWHLPVDTGRHTKAIQPKSLEHGPRTRHFEIDVQPVPGGKTPAPTDRRDRGLLGTVVEGAAHALVFRFVAPALLDKAVEKMEAHVKTGLVHLTDTDVSGWKRFETLDQLHLPKDRPARLLLFIHGTFSSTAGGFGALGVGENGPGFLRTAIAAYDAVIGYDHKTLSLDPKQNAEDLLERLRTHQPEAELVIDIITHSLGGLTTRSFVEEVLPPSGWPATVDNIVFVASTHGGTHLADPERWSDMVDLYTNLAAVSARVLTLAGAGAVGVIVGGVVKGIGAFVKYLVSYAAKGDDVPGLKAMVPGGAFVTELNKEQPGQPGPGTNWFVVSSNFHVSLFDDHHMPKEFSKELARKLKEGFVDQLFHGDNDLVVDVASMSAIGPKAGGFVRDTCALGENDVVYHNNYFSQLKVITALGSWLPLGMGAGGGEEVGDAVESSPVTRGLPPDFVQPMGAAPPAEVRRSRPADGEPTATPAHLAAEMPGHVAEKTDFVVSVRLSRSAIVPTAGAAHVEAEVRVDADRPLSVQVVGKKNVRITGTGADVFALPPGGGSSELTFTAQARSPGECVVKIVVKQGTVTVGNLSLKSTAVRQKDAATMPLGTTSGGDMDPMVDAPELEGLPCIEIYERELTNGRVSYLYAVRIEPEKPAQHFESAPIRDREAKIGTILDDVAKVWKNTGGDPKERERKLQDIGSKMFDELFPQEMQAYLWSKKSKINDLLVYADEPFVPWELVHLKPPTGPREDKPRFLAQAGMVRWQPGSFPPREMHVRRGRARSLVPSYKDPMYALTEPAFEEQFLTEKFKASKVTATPNGVRTLLRSGAFDLFHFSGHGAADPSDILDAKLLLQGLKRAGTVEPQYLGATTVSENACWAKQGTAGPVVVLNACQAGRAGELLTTVGGFAKAFLDAGASAFVSCLWSVQEQPSRVFVEKLYDELLAGHPISLATTRAREAARKAGDATWLAFVVYARPDAVLVTS